MRLKIHPGTTRDDEPSLCLTCRHATIIRGRTLRDEIVDCGLLFRESGRITFPVTFCSGYSDRREPTLRQMEEMAWVLRTDRRKKPIGFVPARELRPKERHVLDEEEFSLAPALARRRQAAHGESRGSETSGASKAPRWARPNRARCSS